VLAWCIGEALMKGKASMLGAASGAVAGLVAITPACGNVGLIGGGMVIGFVAGFACLWGVNGLKRMLGADDSLDVFGVHGVGGIVGALLTGVFNSPPGRPGAGGRLGHRAQPDRTPSGETVADRERRLMRECKGRPNAGACLGFAS
jgi:Amt family ammonium transporter